METDGKGFAGFGATATTISRTAGKKSASPMKKKKKLIVKKKKKGGMKFTPSGSED